MSLQTSMKYYFSIFTFFLLILRLQGQSLNELPIVTGPKLLPKKNELYTFQKKEKSQFDSKVFKKEWPPLLKKNVKPKPVQKTIYKKFEKTGIAKKNQDNLRDFQKVSSKKVSYNKVPYNKVPYNENLPKRPDYYQGLYLSNYLIRDKKRYQAILKKAKEHSINTILIDVQPLLPSNNFLREVKDQGFYTIARVVVFPGGIKKYPYSQKKLEKVIHYIKQSAKAKFSEVQLDYIRFSDTHKFPKISFQERYDIIENIISNVKKILEAKSIYLGVDVFGRTSFNHSDRIGQKIEVFTPYIDTIYPMLYPSHFYGMPKRIQDPYGTIFIGIQNTKERIKTKECRVVAFIQAFKMNIKESKLSYVDYIYQQLLAAKLAKGSGYIAWNAKNQYNAFFRALKKLQKLEASASNY